MRSMGGKVRVHVLAEHIAREYTADMTGGHEQKPATKQDLAEIKEELMETLLSKDDFESAVQTLATKDDMKNLATKQDISGLRELLKGPEGIIDRLEEVEKRVGLKV